MVVVTTFPRNRAQKPRTKRTPPNQKPPATERLRGDMAHPRGAPAPSERRGKPCFIEIRRAKFVAICGPARQKARRLSDGGEGGGCGELGGGGGEGSAWFGGGGFELVTGRWGVSTGGFELALGLFCGSGGVPFDSDLMS